MNPILPRKYFTPDAEAHPMPDGRLYIYGSNDKSGAGRKIMEQSTTSVKHFSLELGV